MGRHQERIGDAGIQCNRGGSPPPGSDESGDHIVVGRRLTRRHERPGPESARIAGPSLKQRWAGWDREPFRAASPRHISVYAPASLRCHGTATGG